jgi:hypothetical protein
MGAVIQFDAEKRQASAAPFEAASCEARHILASIEQLGLVVANLQRLAEQLDRMIEFLPEGEKRRELSCRRSKIILDLYVTQRTMIDIECVARELLPH